MKEQKPAAFSSTLARILASCASQAKDYGRCIAAKVPEIEHNMCSKEFLALRACMQTVILEPSKELAVQLMELGQQHSPTRKLGMDMLRERGLHHDYVTTLLQDGYFLEALRYARKHKVITVHPALFLEKAVAKNSAQSLAAVLSFFCEFTPSFKTTSDFGRYRHILSEMV